MNATVTTPETDTATEFVSVREAATLLRISQSTLWRWLGNGVLQGYRRGGRRVWLLRSDVEALTAPIAHLPVRDAATGFRVGRERLSPAEQQTILAALDAADQFRERLLRARGGRLFSSSADEIASARRERSAQRN